MAKRKNASAAASLVPLLTAEQVTTHLGISTRTLYRYIDSRKLTCYKLDGLLRFNPADVKRFLERRALRASGILPAPFETLSNPEQDIQSNEYRPMSDEEAQAFFAGIKRDEYGCLMTTPDDSE
jgi:excisionase family DNA binding protein